MGRFKMQALTHCDGHVMNTHTTVSQFKCQFSGAMERYMHICGLWVRFGTKLTYFCHDTPPTVSIPLGDGGNV